MKLFIVQLLFFNTIFVIAQQYAASDYYLIDSLNLEGLTEADQLLLDTTLKQFHTAKEDTQKVILLSNICENMENDSWVEYQYYQYHLIKNFVEQNYLGNKMLLNYYALAINNIGIAEVSKANLNKGAEFFKKSIDIYIELGDERGLAEAYNNLGYVYEQLANIPEALSYYHKSIKIKEKIEDKKGLVSSLNNIGILYNSQEDYESAIKKFQLGLDISKEIDYQKGIADNMSNIGLASYNQGKYIEALNYYFQSIKIYRELGDKLKEALIYNNIGSNYKRLNQTDSSLVYFNKALEINTSINSFIGLSRTYANLGNAEIKSNNLNKAEKYGLLSLEYATKLQAPNEIKSVSSMLFNLYELKGDGEKALKYYKQYIQMRDSISNQENQKAAIRQQTQYEFEKEQIRKENEAKEKARIEAEQLKRRDNLEYSLIFLGILLLFGIVLMLGFIKVSNNVAEGLIFFSFLILFEFILVFAEPYINEYTDGEPIYTLLANAAIALLIFPLHDKLEDLLKKRIVKK